MKLNNEDGELLADPFVYRRLMGKLLYLTITRPDLAYSINKLSQFVSKPRTSQLQAVHSVFKYVKEHLVKVTFIMAQHISNSVFIFRFRLGNLSRY